MDDELDVAPGSRYVFYLSPVTDSAGVVGNRLYAPVALPVTEDDRVLLPNDELMTLSSFETFAASRPYTRDD